MKYDIDNRLAFAGRQKPVLPQALVDIFHVDNRIVDETAYGNGDAAETHSIDSVAQCIEYEYRYYDRQRQCYYRNNRSADVHQEDEQYDDDKQRTLDERTLEIAHRALYEVVLTENIGRYFHVGGQGQCHCFELAVDGFGE